MAEIVTYKEYTPKSLLITGNTKPYKRYLKEAGGKWNASLQGWIFSKKLAEDKVKKLVKKINSAELEGEEAPKSSPKKIVHTAVDAEEIILEQFSALKKKLRERGDSEEAETLLGKLKELKIQLKDLFAQFRELSEEAKHLGEKEEDAESEETD